MQTTNVYPARELLGGILEGVERLDLHKRGEASTDVTPQIMVPFPRDPNFVDRPSVWPWLEEQYAGPSHRMALVGFGGFG